MKHQDREYDHDRGDRGVLYTTKWILYPTKLK